MENKDEHMAGGMDEINNSKIRVCGLIAAGAGIALAAAAIASNIKAERAFHDFMDTQGYVSCVESIDKMTWTIPKNIEMGNMERYLVFDIHNIHNSCPDDDWFLAKEDGFFKVNGVEVEQICTGAYAPACRKVPRLGENYTLEKICNPVP